MPNKAVSLKLLREPILLGEEDVTLIYLLGEPNLAKLVKKFEKYNHTDVYLGLREVIKFLYLSAHSNSAVFFPGNQFVDDIWHALITETKEYRLLCNKIKQGSFIDHSGVKLEDYIEEKSNEVVHLEQLSWLASYKKNFGPLEEQVFQMLPLAQSIAHRIGGGISELNQLADSLIAVSKESDIEPKFISLQDFLENEVTPIATEIDSNISEMNVILKSLVLGISATTDLSRNLPSNADLEEVFCASTALAFVLWQYLAVLERLQSLPKWQTKNEHLWKSLISGTKISGLATTQLAQPGGAGLKGEKCVDGYLIDGMAPWVCGYGIFDLLLIGFETSESIYFALINFPVREKNVTHSFQKMICLNGTATVSLKFDKFFIDSKSVVSSRLKDLPLVPRTSAYVIPELGIAKRAIREMTKIITNSQHPRHLLVAKNIDKLKSRVAHLEMQRDGHASADELILLRDEINRDAVRMLTIAMGASAFKEKSLPARLQLETILLDSVIHSPSSLAAKISHLGSNNV